MVIRERYPHGLEVVMEPIYGLFYKFLGDSAEVLEVVPTRISGDDSGATFMIRKRILARRKRYRQKIHKREDIARHWALSESDIRRIRQLYTPSDVSPPKQTATLRAQ